jgi:hypothetical protein
LQARINSAQSRREVSLYTGITEHAILGAEKAKADMPLSTALRLISYYGIEPAAVFPTRAELEGFAKEAQEYSA